MMCRNLNCVLVPVPSTPAAPEDKQERAYFMVRFTRCCAQAQHFFDFKKCAGCARRSGFMECMVQKQPPAYIYRDDAPAVNEQMG